jgi:hypothetical protein
VAEGSVQPPDGLRKIAKSAVEEFVQVWNGEFGDFTEAIADAVLAALFDACEVREQWGVRNTWPDGRLETYWRGHRSYAEAVVRAQLKLGSTVERQLVRRCDLLTPPESVVSYPENQEDGD